MEDLPNLKKKLKRHAKKTKKIYHTLVVKKLQHATLLVLLIGFFLLLVVLWMLRNNLNSQIQKLKTHTLPFPVTSSSVYPVVTKDIAPSVSAQAAIIMDNDSKVVLFAKNAVMSFPMASTTKIMTALVAMDYYKPHDVLTIYTEKVEGVKVGFDANERVRFDDLLYSLLLPSGNDAALALAQNYKGGERAFIAAMNKKANDYHLLNTKFEDSIGLSEGNRTTAQDLAWLASIAIKNAEFVKIVSTTTKHITTLNGNTYSLVSLNKLLGYQGVNGIKTGFTDEAGQVLVTSKVENGHTIIMVVMKSEDRFADTQKLLGAISSHITFLSIHP